MLLKFHFAWDAGRLRCSTYGYARDSMENSVNVLSAAGNVLAAA